MQSNRVPFIHPWQEQQLGQVADIEVGGTPSTAVPQYWNGDIPWVTSGDVHQKRITSVSGRISQLGLVASNAKLIEPPAIAIALAGQGKTRGTAALILTPMAMNQSVAMIQPVENSLTAEYLYHALDLRYEELRARSSGGGRGGLSKSILSVLPIPVPPLAEQRRIADILDTADAAIQHTEALIAKLKLMRAGLLQDLLTRGLDEHGELRDPAANPEQFKETPLGLLPREWELARVENVGQVQLGRQRSPQYQSGIYTTPYLRVANVFDGFIDYSDVLAMDFTPVERKVYMVEPDDILLNEGQSLELVGRSALFDGPPDTYCFQNTLVRYRCNPGLLEPAFAQCVFKFWLDTGRFTTVAKQTTSIAHLGADRFAKMPFPLPTPSEQRRVAQTLATANARIRAEEAYRDKLKLLKQGLMDDLLTGRVRVPVPVEEGVTA